LSKIPNIVKNEGRENASAADVLLTEQKNKTRWGYCDKPQTPTLFLLKGCPRLKGIDIFRMSSENPLSLSLMLARETVENIKTAVLCAAELRAPLFVWFSSIK